MNEQQKKELSEDFVRQSVLELAAWGKEIDISRTRIQRSFFHWSKETKTTARR